MHAAAQLKVAPTTTHSTLAKSRQPTVAAPKLDGNAVGIQETQAEENARTNHSLGAISIFPPEPPVQPKRANGLVNRLSSFTSPSQPNINSVTGLMGRWTACPPIQAKLTVGPANDQYEQEADRVADQVMRMAEPRVQAKCACGGEAGADGECAACKAKRLEAESQVQTKPEEEDILQTKSEGVPTDATPDLESRLNGSRGSGSALPEETRSSMESAFGMDFGGVRVHTGTEAVQMNRELSAQAFTHGSDIYFNAGKYDPRSAEGKGLLAHELTHVVQQSSELITESIQQSPDAKCGKEFQFAFNAIANSEQEKDHRGVPRLFYLQPTGRKEDIANANISLKLAPGTKFEAGQTSSNKLWRAVCYSPASGAPNMIFWVLDEYVSNQDAKATSKSQSTPDQTDPNQPLLETYEGTRVNKLGHVSAPANQYTTAKSSGVNVRARPDGALPAIAKVLYDTEVQVRALDTTGAFYFIISRTGAVGWINKDFVALDPPDTEARLHHITEENLTTILKNEYVDKKLWSLATGNDYTTLAAAVVVANQGRRGISVDWEKAKKYKDDNPFKVWLDPWMIDNFAIYDGSTILAGHNIWLPSPSYIRMLQRSGVIGSRPGWINAAVDIGKGIAGFVAGVISGIFGSLWDTLTGLWELGKSIVNTVKSTLDGSLFASIEEIYHQITNMTWEDLKKIVDEIITMGQNAFNDFQKKWNHPDTYQQWHFKGYIVGAIALEVVLAIFTGGGTLAAKVLAKVGKYFPKLMKILNRLLDLADKLPGRRRKADVDQPRKGKDRDKDDNEMNHDDRAWEQARIMAALVTEEHDLQDTPVERLIPLLNATIAARFKVVSGYKAIPLGQPNTYQIIQTARKKNVDDHYTEKSIGAPHKTGTWTFNPKVDAHVKTHDEAVTEAFRRAGVPLDEFEVTQWGKTKDGKSIPVEWTVLKGPSAQVNMDDPTIVPTIEGPQSPHVGYQTPGKRQGGGAIRGHIFPEKGVLATRGSLKDKK